MTITAQLTKGADGFGMKLSAEGAVTAYAGAGGPGEAAGIPIGARLVQINGVSVASKKEVVAQLKLAGDGAPVAFTYSLAEPEPEPEPAPAPAALAAPREYLCVAVANVRSGRSVNDAKVREIVPGSTVTVLEEAHCDGHHRGRIGEGEWLSIRTKLGNQLLEPLDGSGSGGAAGSAPPRPAGQQADVAAPRPPEPGFPPNETVEKVEIFATESRTEPGPPPKEYTVYCIRCTPQEGAPWEVERRFSEFFTLWYALEAAGATAVNRLVSQPCTPRPHPSHNVRAGLDESSGRRIFRLGARRSLRRRRLWLTSGARP